MSFFLNIKVFFFKVVVYSCHHDLGCSNSLNEETLFDLHISYQVLNQLHQQAQVIFGELMVQDAFERCSGLSPLSLCIGQSMD